MTVKRSNVVELKLKSGKKYRLHLNALGLRLARTKHNHEPSFFQQTGLEDLSNAEFVDHMLESLWIGTLPFNKELSFDDFLETIAFDDFDAANKAYLEINGLQGVLPEAEEVVQKKSTTRKS